MFSWGYRYLIIFFVCSTPCLYAANHQSPNSKIVQKNFEIYQPDMGPLKSSPIGKQYSQLKNKTAVGDKLRAIYQKRYSLIRSLVEQNPKWIDGYWIFASEAFQLGSTFIDEKDHPIALDVFSQGEKASKKCLTMVREHPLCMMFLGANMAAAATIRGVLASLRHGSEILELWEAVYHSNVNYQFTPEVSLQGSVRYALGLFYRLVPDSRVLSWIFGVSGDIDRSVNLHKEVLAIDGQSPCGNLMLAAAMICRTSSKAKDKEIPYANNLLREAHGLSSLDMNQIICRQGSRDLLANNSLACGYTTAKQQDLNQEKTQTLQGRLERSN